jgi:hypothetical protein
MIHPIQQVLGSALIGASFALVSIQERRTRTFVRILPLAAMLRASVAKKKRQKRHAPRKFNRSEAT